MGDGRKCNALAMWNRTGPRHLVFLLLVAVGLSGCSPPDPGRVILDLAFDPDGRLVEVDAGHGTLLDDQQIDLLEMGTVTEACLDNGTCVRIVDEREIVESSDGWATSTVVWSMSPEDTWWGHRYDDGFNPMVIGLYDIVVLPDQSVAVASGQLPLIERSLEGQWTPTESELRSLPRSFVLFGVAAAFSIVAVGFGFGAPHRGAGAARAALATFSPMLVLGALATLLAVKAPGLLVLGLLLMPLALTSLGLLVGSILGVRAQEGFLSGRARRVFGASVVAVAGWIATYGLWVVGIVSWNAALGTWVVSFVIAAIAAGWPNPKEKSPRSRLPGESPSIAGTVIFSVTLSYLAIIAASAFSAFATGPDLLSALVGLVWLALVVGVVVFTASRTLAKTALPQAGARSIR